MSNIAISYSDKGFNPTETSANPGDTIAVTNNATVDISLSFSSPSTSAPLHDLTSPTPVPQGGMVSGKVREAASNHPLTFTVGGASCTVEIGAAEFQITASPTSLEPKSLQVNAGDDIVIFNQSQTSTVTIEVESKVADPLGPVIGMETVIDPQGQVRGPVASAAKGKKIKLTVKGSTSTTSTIDVRSGDTDVASAQQQQQQQSY